MTEPETPNLSDAILLALHRYGWIGPLTTKRDYRPPQPQRRSPGGRKLYSPPRGVVIPPGVYWNPYGGIFAARIFIRGRNMVYLGRGDATQAGADLAGRMIVAAKAAKATGADVDAIKAAARAVLESI